MAENKTKETTGNVSAFIEGVADAKRRQECLTILQLMQSVTEHEPKMWGSSMVGFGTYHYKYESGREGDYFLTGFSPRKRNLTLYLMSGFDQLGPYLARLGKHSTGKSCLYIDTLDDVDMGVLREMIEQSVSMKNPRSGAPRAAAKRPKKRAAKRVSKRTAKRPAKKRKSR